MQLIKVPVQYQTDHLVILLWIVFLTCIHKCCESYFGAIVLVTLPMTIIYYFRSPYLKLRKRFKAAIIYMNRGQYSEAINIWVKISNTKPSPKVYAILADCYAETGQYELAVKNIRKYLERYPDDFGGTINYGIYLYLNEEKDKAIEILGSLKAKVKKEEDINVLASAFRYVNKT